MPETSKGHKLLRLTVFLCLTYVLLAVTFDFMPWPASGLAPGQAGIDLEPPVIRFHVLAHSDDPADQAVKNRVRDEALRYLSPKLSPGASLEEVHNLLEAEKERLTRVLQDFLQRMQVDQGVSILFLRETFPTRTYAGRVYPAGEYDTFQIVLGEGLGQNWWCVMFPPLCLTELALIPERPAAEEPPEDSLGEGFIPGPVKDESPPPLPLRLGIVDWLRRIFGKG